MRVFVKVALGPVSINIMVKSNRKPSESVQTKSRKSSRSQQQDDGGPTATSDVDSDHAESRSVGGTPTGRRSPTPSLSGKSTGTPRQLPEIPSVSRLTPSSSTNKLTSISNKLTSISSSVEETNRKPNNKTNDKDEPNKPICTATSCNKEVSREDQAIICNKCDQWTHRTCAGITQTDYKSLTKSTKYENNIMWFCDTCLPVVTNIIRGATPTSPARTTVKTSKHDKSLTDMTKKLDDVIKGFKRVEESLLNKETNMETLIEEKVAMFLEEKKEREDRECNLIFHNLPESTSEIIDDRKTHDADEVTATLEAIDIDDVDIFKPIRLGKKDTSNTRPRLLKITVSSGATKRQVLKNARKLRECDNDAMKKVYITPDLTYQERCQNRKLRQDLKYRRENGEEDLIIKNGRIVKGDQNFRTFRTKKREERGVWSDDEQTAHRSPTASAKNKGDQKSRGRKADSSKS